MRVKPLFAIRITRPIPSIGRWCGVAHYPMCSDCSLWYIKVRLSRSQCAKDWYELCKLSIVSFFGTHPSKLSLPICILRWHTTLTYRPFRHKTRACAHLPNFGFGWQHWKWRKLPSTDMGVINPDILNEHRLFE